MPKTFLQDLDVIIMIAGAVVLFVNVRRINKIASKFPGTPDPFNFPPFMEQSDRDKIWKYRAFMILAFIAMPVLIVLSWAVFNHG